MQASHLLKQRETHLRHSHNPRVELVLTPRRWFMPTICHVCRYFWSGCFGHGELVNTTAHMVPYRWSASRVTFEIGAVDQENLEHTCDALWDFFYCWLITNTWIKVCSKEMCSKIKSTKGVKRISFVKTCRSCIYRCENWLLSVRLPIT